MEYICLKCHTKLGSIYSWLLESFIQLEFSINRFFIAFPVCTYIHLSIFFEKFKLIRKIFTKTRIKKKLTMCNRLLKLCDEQDFFETTRPIGLEFLHNLLKDFPQILIFIEGIRFFKLFRYFRPPEVG